MFTTQNRTQNRLLSALPTDEFNRLAPYMEPVLMPFGESYYETEGKFQYVYFPTTSIVSLHHCFENGTSAELASVGNEGMLGISLFMEGADTPSRAIVRAAGHGYKMKAQFLMDEFNRSGPIRRLLVRYTQALITQLSQTALCVTHHSVSQQLCRWLLLTLDRIPSKELILTRELIADMIGAPDEVISDECDRLKQAGIINDCHGRITVLNRSGLEERACECYRVIKKEYGHLLGLDWDWRPMPESVKTWSRANASVGAQI